MSFTDAETSDGGVVSDELLVTGWAVKLAASAPVTDWMALVSLPAVGSV
nr:hypothetical protein [Azospirillum argentinense]